MTAGLETLLSIDWDSLVKIIGCLGTVAGAVVSTILELKRRVLGQENTQLKEENAAVMRENTATKNFFSSDCSMDDDQREIATQKDIEKAWRMPEWNFAQMYDVLYNQRKVEIRREDLRKAVDDAEADLQPEYAIVMMTPKGEIDTEATHVFVTYGFAEYHMNYDNLMQKWRDTNCEKVYPVTEHWHLSNEEKNKIMKEIGNNPGCIVYVTNIIEENESKGMERYGFTCGDQYWVVERGKVAQIGAGGDLNAHIAREAANDNDVESD